MELKTIYHLFSECWKFYKKYHDRQFDEAIWEQVLKDGRALHVKYQKSVFAREMILAVISELERIDRRKINQEDL